MSESVQKKSLKQIAKEFKSRLNSGIFRNYFIGSCIENTKDRDAFLVYYSDKISAAAMAGLLGLDIKCYDRTLTATSPETGRQGVMTFDFAPAFKSADHEATFNSDFENLLKFENFLMGEMYAKFGDAVRNMHQFVEHREFLLNYLRVNHSSHEYLYEKYKLLIQTAKSRTYYGCLTTSSYDFDVVLVSATATIEWFRRRNVIDRESDIGYVEIERAIKSNLKNQIVLTEEDRKKMLYNMHKTKETYEKDDASYWDYIKIMKNISENTGAF